MTLPVEITFDGMEPSEAIRASIEKHARQLEKFAPNITSFRAVVAPVERRHQKGNRYAVKLHVTMPSRELDAGRTPRENHSHENPYVAVSDAFDALRKQLQSIPD